MPLSKYTEKAGGAENVSSWDCRIVQDFHPLWVLGKRWPEFFDGQPAQLEISVRFWDRTSALEFQRKVIDMLPEVRDAT